MHFPDNITLKYFKPEEFRSWGKDMSISFLVRLDCFRGVLGYPVEISQADGSLGRQIDSGSGHSFYRWGKVIAGDVFPQNIVPQQWVEVALQCGFMGIGLYVDTKNNYGVEAPMLHLDIKPRRWVGGRVNGKYVTFKEAYEYWQETNK